jgi:hypothetical protein
MMELNHQRAYYMRLPEGPWEEFVIDTGTITYHILFDKPAGEIYQTNDYEYKWELAPSTQGE